MRLSFAWLCMAVVAFSPAWSAPQDSPAKPNAKPARLDALGDPLPEGAIARLGTLRMRLATYIAVSPDGKLIAGVAKGDHAIKLWDTSTGKEIRRLQVDANRWPVAPVFSPDGNWLATASSSGENGNQPSPPCRVLLWDVRSGKLLREMNGPVAAIGKSIAFADKGKTILCSSEDGTVRWWEAVTGRLLKTWDPFAKQRKNLRDQFFISRPGAGRQRPGRANIGMALTRQAIPEFLGRLGLGFRQTTREGDRRLRLYALCHFLNGRQTNGFRLTSNDDIYIWRLGSNQPAEKLEGTLQDTPHAIAFSPDGKTLGSALEDASITLWDVVTKKILRQSERYLTCIGGFFENTQLCLNFLPDDKGIVTAALGHVRIWDVKDFSEKLLLPGHRDVIWNLSFSADGRNLFSSQSNQIPGAWDTTSWQPTGRPQACEDAGKSLLAISHKTGARLSC